MTDRIKENDEIRADEAAFMAAYERASKVFERIEGVAGVGFGLKATGSDFTDDLAILVFVHEKKSNESLPPDQRIPPTFEGYRTDVRVLMPVRLEAFQQRCDDIRVYGQVHGGIQIQPWGAKSPKTGIWFGTLGCIVKRRRDESPDNVYLLTCKHVLYDPMAQTSDGDGVWHPWHPEPAVPGLPGVGVPERKGTLLGKIREEDTFIGINKDGYFIDAAVLRVDIGSYCCDSSCTKDRVRTLDTIQDLNLDNQPFIDLTIRDRITDVRDCRSDLSLAGAKVFKVGRTTGRTPGKVVGVAVPGDDVDVVTGATLVARPKVLEIVFDGPPGTKNCKGNDAFTEPGDSGAIIVDDRNHAIGMHFQKGFNRTLNRLVSHACHIVPVLDALNVCIPTKGGHSHGTTDATDGSGLKPPVTASLAQPNEEGMVLVSRDLVSEPVERAPTAAPISVTDEEAERLFALRDAFRETARGRALHESFAEVRREIAYLVRHCRPVTVTWHRHRGPAFLACAINHLKGDADALPREIGGVSRATLLARMGEVLAAHGSNPLIAAIERHRAELMSLSDAATVEECLDQLRLLGTTA